MKIKFNSNDELPLNNKMAISILKIVVKAVLHGSNKYYPQDF